jgi:PAS domain-containing protein
MARVPEGADTTMAAPRKEKEGFEPLRATVEQMGMGIAQVSLDGKWLMVSHRLCEILGYCENELLQTSFEIFFGCHIFWPTLGGTNASRQRTLQAL